MPSASNKLLDLWYTTRLTENLSVPPDVVKGVLKELGLLPKQKVQKTGYYVYVDLGTDFDFCATPEAAWEAWEKHLRYFPEDKEKGVLVTHTWEVEE